MVMCKKKIILSKTQELKSRSWSRGPFPPLQVIPFVNSGQLPTSHFSFTIESSGHKSDRITIWDSNIFAAAWQHLTGTRLF